LKNQIILLTLFAVSLISCNSDKAAKQKQDGLLDDKVIQPFIVSEKVIHDTDDPAIWINREDKSKSLIIGTDKYKDGALYVYDLNGKIIKSKVVKGLARPNNVDIEYGLNLGGNKIDIAVATLREGNSIRIYKLPEMEAIDGGGIPIFVGESKRGPMGISLYKNPSDEKIYAIVGRKDGPKEDYLWQYLLEDSGNGIVTAKLVRKFGKYSGTKEIESISVDDGLGYVYYSDEGIGVRKYYADPTKGNQELALFANTGFKDDHEGISIYKLDDVSGYIIVSDQQANRFHIFSREGSGTNQHEHKLLKIVNLATDESDGSDVISLTLNENFQGGMFVAMSADKTFHYYRWIDIAGKDLKVRK